MSKQKKNKILLVITEFAVLDFRYNSILKNANIACTPHERKAAKQTKNFFFSLETEEKNISVSNGKSKKKLIL